MFPILPETVENTTDILRSPFAFTMGPFTIYPLFLLPLIFWISPISSTDTTASGKSDLKEHKLHQVYTQTPSEPSEYSEDGQEQLPFYANQPLNLQSPPSSQKDRYYAPSPLSYYPSLYSYQNQMFNYPSYSSLPAYPYANINPYLQASPYPPPQNYQSHLYDPYVMMMHMAQQPSKYQSQSYQSTLLPQSPNLSNMLSQSPQQIFQAVHSNSFFPSRHQQQQQQSHSQQQQHSKPLSALQEAQQLLNSMQTDPQSVMSAMSPESGHMLYSSTSGDPTSLQSTYSQGQGQQNPYQTSAASSVFSSLSPDTQQMLSSLSPPFGYIDKQTKDSDSIMDIIKNAPPKAIMTTASEAILGLRGGSQKHSPFTYTPDKHKQTMHKHKGQPGFKRKPPVVQYNRYSNNKKFNFGNRVVPAVHDYMKKTGKGVKSANATVQEPVQQDKVCENCEDEEDDQEEAPPKFISEPIIPGSVISTPSWEMIEAIMAKTKKDAKPEQAHNILPHDTEDREDPPPQTPMDLQNDDPIPLFVIGDEDEDSRYFTTQTDKNQEDPSFNSFKHQIYRCPSSRDLRELSEAEIYADPLKCNQFYYCKWGRAYVFKCPVSHVFNPFSNICERDEDFACAMSLKK